MYVLYTHLTRDSCVSLLCVFICNFASSPPTTPLIVHAFTNRRRSLYLVAIPYVMGLWKANQTVTLSLFDFIALANGCIRALPMHSIISATTNQSTFLE